MIRMKPSVSPIMKNPAPYTAAAELKTHEDGSQIRRHSGAQRTVSADVTTGNGTHRLHDAKGTMQ